MNVQRALIDIVKNLDPSVKPTLMLGANWIGEGIVPEYETDGPRFVLLITNAGGDEQNDDEQFRYHFDLYGPGVDITLTKADELKDKLHWSKFGGCSYHGSAHGMVDDITTAVLPHPVASDLDQATLVTTTYTVSTRDV